MSFYVGQKVVCVIGEAERPCKCKIQEDVPILIKGTVYTVAVVDRRGLILWEMCQDGGYTFDRFRQIDPLHEALDRIEDNHTVEPEPAFA